MKNLFISTFTIAYIVFLSTSCKKETNENNITENKTFNCLKVDPYEWFSDVNFNEQWIAHTKVKMIIERNYRLTDEGEYQMPYLSVYDFNEDGYPTSKYSKYNFTEDTLAIEDGIKGKRNYVYEKSDSLLIQHTKTISYYDREGNQYPTPQIANHNFSKTYMAVTNQAGEKIYRLISRAPYSSSNIDLLMSGDIVLFDYDEAGRLIHSLDGDIDYIDDTTIHIEKECFPWSAGMPMPCSFTLKSNANGQIVAYKSGHPSLNVNRYQVIFKYNEAGEMIRKEQIGGEQESQISEYTTYSYHR